MVMRTEVTDERGGMDRLLAALEFMGEKVVMLHHTADIEVTVKLPDSASGEVRIPLILTAQACDDKICLQPSDIAVVANVTVE